MSTVRTEVPIEQIVGAMPKAELHLHLDGCLRLETVVDLAAEQKLDLPVPPERIAELCVAPQVCQDLMEVLAYFATPLRVLQTPEALERATYELCDDLSRENVRYAEIRFGPSLHRRAGMSRHEAIQAVVRGWHAGRRAFGLAGGIIVCGLRELPAAETQAVAEEGLPFLGHGVVGFDLAGDEAGFPVALHRDPLLWAKRAGYGMTVHAGEAAGAESVRDAVEMIGVTRVGHGVRAHEDPTLAPLLRERAVTLEMCPTSNVHTCAVPSFESHPIGRFYHAGVRVTVNSDNRTVSSTTVSRELLLGHERMGLELADLGRITLTALDAGFLDAAERRALAGEFRRSMRALGVIEGPGASPDSAVHGGA